MANQKYLDILRQGVDVWNAWRKDESSGKGIGNHNSTHLDMKAVDLIRMNLSGANFKNTDFRRSDFSLSNLSEADLSGAIFSNTHFRSTNLERANLKRTILSNAFFGKANLSGSYLSGSHLHGVNFRESELVEANLSYARLNGADFTRANANYAKLDKSDIVNANLSFALFRNASFRGALIFSVDFTSTDLNKADFNSARLGLSKFGSNDLSTVRGLETILHFANSIISIDTIYASRGNIPEVFLRNTGAPDDFIDYLLSLIKHPNKFYSCFISYSNENQDFAQRIYNDLQHNKVRCWFAPEDMKIGDKIRDSIEQSIQFHDKLLLVLSKQSIESHWVEHEVEAALEREQKENRLIIFPIRLDDYLDEAEKGWVKNLKRVRHIGDFRNWKKSDDYQKAFSKVLKDLKPE